MIILIFVGVRYENACHGEGPALSFCGSIDNIEFAKLILEIPLTTDEMKATNMQMIKKRRLESLQNNNESYSTPF